MFMDGKLGWLADGSMNPIPPQYRDWEKNDYEHPSRGAEERRAAEQAKAARKSAA
jgi:hypothetical protein